MKSVFISFFWWKNDALICAEAYQAWLIKFVVYQHSHVTHINNRISTSPVLVLFFLQL